MRGPGPRRKATGSNIRYPNGRTSGFGSLWLASLRRALLSVFRPGSYAASATSFVSIVTGGSPGTGTGTENVTRFFGRDADALAPRSCFRRQRACRSAAANLFSFSGSLGRPRNALIGFPPGVSKHVPVENAIKPSTLSPVIASGVGGTAFSSAVRDCLSSGYSNPFFDFFGFNRFNWA